MFGLLRPYHRSASRRLHYCGTCKTIGREYGQASRALLNHDTVFLAEILSDLGPPTEWSEAYRSYNCANLPKEEMPVALRFAAAATMALADFRVRDKIADRPGALWKAARRAFRKPFGGAADRLKSLGFPLRALEDALASQDSREAAPRSLEQLAAPTAAATSMFFSHGVTLVNRAESTGPAAEAGRRFGELIYVLDAFEDFDRDLKSGEFNALRALGLTREDGRREIRRRTQAFEDALAGLPLSPAFHAEIVSRLRANVARKLGESLPVLCSHGPKTIRQAWKDRWDNARTIARSWAQREGTVWWKAAGVATTVSVIAFVMPREAKAAGSYRECMSLGLSLMTFGSLLAMAAGPVPEISGKKDKTGWLANCCCCPGDCSGCCECDSCCDSSCCECGSCCDGCSCDC